MDLIDIEAERRKKAAANKKKSKNGPENNCSVKGPDGKTYFLFSVNYSYQGRNYTFDIWALSRRDAGKRIDAIKRFPVEVTQTIAIIEA